MFFCISNINFCRKRLFQAILSQRVFAQDLLQYRCIKKIKFSLYGITGKSLRSLAVVCAAAFWRVTNFAIGQ